MFAVASLRTGDGKPGNPVDKMFLVVRARCPEHLQSLKRAYPELAEAPITESESADYRARIMVSKSVWLGVLNEMTLEIDYDKVKPAMHEAGRDGRRDDGPLNYDRLIMSVFMDGQHMQDNFYHPVGRIDYSRSSQPPRIPEQ